MKTFKLFSFAICCGVRVTRSLVLCVCFVGLYGFSLTWPTFENFIVTLGLQDSFLPESCLVDFIAIYCCFST